MFDGKISQALADGLGEAVEVGVVFGVEALLFDELPEPFNEVEVGRVGGQEEQLDAQGGGVLNHDVTALIAGIVQDDGEGEVQTEGGQLREEFTDLRGSDIGVVGHRDPLVGDGVERAQHIESLATTGGGDEDPRQRPEIAQKRGQHTRGRRP